MTTEQLVAVEPHRICSLFKRHPNVAFIPDIQMEGLENDLKEDFKLNFAYT